MNPEEVSNDIKTEGTPNTNLAEKEAPLANPEAELIRQNQLEKEENLTRLKAILDEPESQEVRIGAYLPGIYGKVQSDDYGEFYLSLTPFETAPRLGDFGFMGVEFDPTITDSLIDNPVKRKEAAKASGAAKTVANRLQASRVVTNFQQEILPPDLDPRFSTKTGLVGDMTRYVDKEGREADRSAFLHVVPDLDRVGGKLPIKYTHYKKDDIGNLQGETRVAHIPVNFNFNNKKLSLTIKEFILNQVYEASSEEYSMTKSFDGYTLRLFGGKPKIINISGQLTNFNDDIISYSQDLKKILVYDSVTGELKEKLASPTHGSQRDLFMTYYENFLSGTKCRDFAMKIFLYYNFRIIEGFFVDFSINSTAENDNYVNFSASMIVVKQFSAFETGIGLGAVGDLKAGDLLAQRNFNTFSDQELSDFESFTSEQNHRELYRSFAYKQAKQLVSLIEQRDKSNYDKTFGENQELRDRHKKDYIDRVAKQYEPTADRDKLESFLDCLLSGINAELTLSGLDTNSKIQAASFFEKDTKININDFINWAVGTIGYPTEKNFYYNGIPTSVQITSAINGARTSFHTTYDSVEGSNSNSVGEQRFNLGSVAELFYLCYQNYFSSK